MRSTILASILLSIAIVQGCAYAGEIPVRKNETTNVVSGEVVFTGGVTLTQGTAPTVNAAGEAAVDTNGDASTITQGVITYYDGTQQLTAAAFDAYPTADGQQLAYSSSTNKIEWVEPKVKVISETIAFGAFTDNTDATGYKDLATQIPAGAIPLGVAYSIATGFTGDTSAIVQTGVAGDLDRFASVTDQSVFATGTAGHGVATDAADGITAAQTIRVTVTGAADFTSIAAGSMTVKVYFVDTQ